MKYVLVLFMVAPLVLGGCVVSSSSGDKDSGEPTVDAPAADPGGGDSGTDTAEDAQTKDATATDGPTTHPDVGSPDVGTDTSAADIIELPTEKPPIDKTYEIFIGDWDMSPGQETTKCTLKRLSNAEPIFVTGLKTVLAKGSHHVIVYKSAETVEKPEPFGCNPFTEGLTGQTFPLMITQVAEEHLEFPHGIAIKLEANQMIRVEAHFLNYYPDPITAHADITFETIKEEHMVAEANMLFYGSPDFSVKANQVTSTDWFRLDQWSGTNVFALTGHTHQLGTNVEVYKTSGGADDGTEIYPLGEEFIWSESPVIQYDPPLYFGEGDGFRYRCTWENNTNKNVGFGESATDEMCFFWAYYYPSQGYRLCINAGSLGAGFGIDQVCCPGSPLCDLLDQWL